MLSKSKIQLISSLSIKKFRDEYGLFVAEGTKLTLDLASTFNCKLLIATKEWLISNNQVRTSEIIEVDLNELRKISNQKNPQGVIAIFEKPTNNWNSNDLKHQLAIVLDDVQDPGNLGTIIRIADWFGITNIFCSEHTADAYSPKTIQATMGAIARVKIHTVNLVDFFDTIDNEIPIYGTFIDGRNMYKESLTQNGIIIMGNEGNGISNEIEKFVSTKLSIPNYPMGEPTSESLNVSVATAIVCAEFRRRAE